MKLSPRQKKWFRILLVLVLIRIVIGIALYYLVEHKFVNIVRYIVNKESGDSYQFDAADIDFSLWNKNIVLRDVKLVCKDTLHVSSHYDVSIPKVYLSIQSWRQLILHKKLLVDSLSVISPALLIHEHMAPGPRQGGFQLSSIVEHLEQTLKYVNAREVHLQEGSLIYSKVNGPAPLRVDHFNLSILHFNQVTSSDSHILGSDDVDFSFDNQHWILPDGRNTISFKRLHFSGKRQIFELDSCTIFSGATDTKGEMSLQADKFYFNARHLPAIYMREELLIDTLVCIRPVLKLPGRKATNKDKMVALDSIPNTLFKKINFKYIDVQDGELLLTGNVSTGGTKRTNLNIYNLTIARDSTPVITTDSIQLNLDKIKFYSLDSMFQLSVDEFILHHNDVIFKNVAYSPTPQNRSGKGLTFTAPSLRLHNVSLEDLLRKRINASDAELYQPGITFLTKQKKAGKTQTATDSTIKLPAFYQTLHGLSELIMVNTFRITDGNVNFTSTGKSPVTLRLKNVNTDILLHNFLMSDSLVDIKHAMPNLRISGMSVTSDKVNITVSNYVFDGVNRHNNAEKLLVSLSNGATIAAKKIYWEVFDWDVFQQTKDIQIDVLRIGELNVNIPHTNAKKTTTTKKLPVIRVASLDIGNLQFNSGGTAQHSFNADKITLKDIRTQQHFVTWGFAAGQFYNIVSNDEKMKLSIAGVSLNSGGTTNITGVAATLYNDNGYTNITAPVLSLQTGIHNTDFSRLLIQSLIIEHPLVEIYSNGSNTKKDKKTASLNVAINKLSVNDAALRYKHINGKDTTTLQTNLSFSAGQLRVNTNSENLLQYAHAAAEITPLQFNSTGDTLSIPQSSLLLTKGLLSKNKQQALSLTSGVSLKWHHAQLSLHHADTMELAIKKLSGMFNDATFSFRQYSKTTWQQFVQNTTISEGDLYYSNKQLHASAAAFTMDPATNTLYISDFNVTPHLSAAETFRTARWQRDYITVKGDALQISGIKFNHLPGDTTIIIRKITADKTILTTARDKRIAFEHGIEKLMPGKLIRTLPFALQVDSIVLQQAAVTVNESSKITNKWATVPITDINALITNFGNTSTGNDSLMVQASGKLLGNPIHHFSYNESYNDSLSGFYAESYLAPMDLRDFNSVAIPMAAVKVKRGDATTIYSNWSGNKYATTGTMNFYYNNLKVQVLNKKDSTRQGFNANLKTFLANTFLHNANHRPTLMFFIRDREKFIFNYWVKAATSGIITAVGVKKNRKYLKKYNKVAKKFSLPRR